ncbi:unnamed protein product [Didymodactylos carnosus]|uniref:C2H2-type domain-containing protein n=1 Tax=Didymodactylos carnosus TaxID=1234261 RepID=A0A813P923_9BILA|nr:unnamed protein product [Didymodactylos carnosus]CAF0856805.1 unnamed protein product [Didymodactylos carnosus]CAF3525800.1 unnamed protein product [Didymodactylos carnosus]CAF3641868.1 unnamed protein product [Didymodactylos carnosus]
MSEQVLDLRINKRIRSDDEENENNNSKKKRTTITTSQQYDIPLDLSKKSRTSPIKNDDLRTLSYPWTMPYPLRSYDPSLLFNPMLYDLFLSNMNNYCTTVPTITTPIEIPTTTRQVTMTTKQQQQRSSSTIKDTSPSLTKDVFISNGKDREIFACSCGEKYTTLANLVSHLKITNHSAQLSSTHDEVAKLVRGQDIWLSRDTNPANQILKCLRCSLSFETLPDLTAHMMKTNHFTQLMPYRSDQTKQLKQSRSTCLICSQQFLREVDLVDHIQRSHRIRHNCTTCGMYFETEQTYKDHIAKEMHHRNGKASRNRDYFLNQFKFLETSLNHQTIFSDQQSPSPPEYDEKIDMKSPSLAVKIEPLPVGNEKQTSIDKDIEKIAYELVENVILPKVEQQENKTSKANALTLLQNFVTKQTVDDKQQNNNINNTSKRSRQKQLQQSNMKVNALLALEQLTHNSIENFQQQQQQQHQQRLIKKPQKDNKTVSVNKEDVNNLDDKSLTILLPPPPLLSPASSSSSSSSHPSIVTKNENESPLASLEKMVSCPETTSSRSSTINTTTTGAIVHSQLDITPTEIISSSQTPIKLKMIPKKFDKYRMFAQKMLRSST